MPTVTNTNFAIKIKNDKRLKIKTIALPENISFRDLDIHVNYNCEEGLVCVGRSLDRESNLFDNIDGYNILKMNKVFHSDNGTHAKWANITFSKADSFKTVETKFNVIYELIDAPEFGIESEGEED